MLTYETDKGNNFPQFKIALGIDVVEINRVKRIFDRWDRRFVQRCFTNTEQKLCGGDISSFAVRFAAKEAVMKALGTGMKGVNWLDIEVHNLPSGAPVLKLHNRAEREADRQGWQSVSLSLTHSAGVAIAVVAAVKIDLTAEIAEIRRG